MNRFLATLLTLLCFTIPANAFAQETTPSDADWWSTRYLVDYGLIAGGAAAYLVAGEFRPNPKALIGPQFDPDDPYEILDPKYSDRLGRDHADETNVVETFPETHVIFMIVGATGLLATQEALVWGFHEDGSAQQFHDTMVGFAESLALTAGVTEIAKVTAGRLRPDFQDRARRYICQTDSSPTIDCTEVPPLADDPDELEDELADGRKSFISGHSSFGLNFTTYFALAIGGHFVWGPNATPTSRALGILGQTLLMTTGVMVAGSRLDDGRHHVTDVLAGSIVGFGLANFAYWRRFGGSEETTETTTRLQVAPMLPGGVSVSLRF